MKKKNNLRTLSVMVVLVLAITLTIGGMRASAGNTTTTDTSFKNIKAKGELVVGLCAQYAPFESRNEKTGKIEGFDIDLAKALGEKLNLKIKIVDAEWEALLGGVIKGDYDVLITCMAKKEASVKNINMSDIYYKLNEIIVVNKDNTTIKSKSDLKGKTVGVQTATSSEQAADKLKGLKEVKRYNRTPEAFIDLKNKRIDAVIVGYAYAATAMKNVKDLKIIDSPVDSSDIVMVSKKGSDSLTKNLNEALAGIKSNGKYKQAVDKWLKLGK